MMNKDILSILVHCSYDGQSEIVQLQVVRLDTDEKVPMQDSYFLLRISSDETGSPVRCLVRHIPSGQEIYMQSGANITDFIKAYLLDHHGRTV